MTDDIEERAERLIRGVGAGEDVDSIDDAKQRLSRIVNADLDREVKKSAVAQLNQRIDTLRAQEQPAETDTALGLPGGASWSGCPRCGADTSPMPPADGERYRTRRCPNCNEWYLVFHRHPEDDTQEGEPA